MYLNFRFCPEQYKVSYHYYILRRNIAISQNKIKEGYLPLMHQIGSTGQSEILLSRRILLQALHTLSDLGQWRLNKDKLPHSKAEELTPFWRYSDLPLSFHLLPFMFLFCPISLWRSPEKCDLGNTHESLRYFMCDSSYLSLEHILF